MERLNRTLGNSLRAVLAERSEQEWDEVLPQILRTLRATPHRSTQETANFLMLGREVNLPLKCLPGQGGRSYVRRDIRGTVAATCPRSSTGAKERTEEGASRTGWRGARSVSAREKVWLSSFFEGTGRGTKLRPKYVGPYTVCRCVPHQTYEVERLGQKTTQHEGRMKHQVAPPDRVPSPEKDPVPPPTPETPVPSTKSGWAWYPEGEAY